MESLSIMDSFFGATLKSIFKKGANGVEVNQELNPLEIQRLVGQVSDNLLFTAHTMAVLHMNIVMARREAVLTDSDMSSEKRASLRALPTEKSLFGEHVHSVIKSHADLMRDLACQAPRPHKKPASSRSTQDTASGSSAKRQAFSKPHKSARGGRSAQSGSGKAKPQDKPKSTQNKPKNF